MSDNWHIYSLSQQEIDTSKSCGVWSKECPIEIGRLKRLQITHLNFEGKTTIGNLILFDVVASYVMKLFKDLYQLKFEIDKVLPIDLYNGSDEKSMIANNSSAYNGRKIMNTDKWSSHAYGMAIDINPVQNPYLKLIEETASIKVIPDNGLYFVNRFSNHPGMVEKVIKVFERYGFTVWGGAWIDKIDYHHFQVDWKHIHKLANMNFNEGVDYYEQYVINPT